MSPTNNFIGLMLFSPVSDMVKKREQSVENAKCNHSYADSDGKAIVISLYYYWRVLIGTNIPANPIKKDETKLPHIEMLISDVTLFDSNNIVKETKKSATPLRKGVVGLLKSIPNPHKEITRDNAAAGK
jgi:hypothetical protein